MKCKSRFFFHLMTCLLFSTTCILSEKKVILVTGGAGFLGSHLCSRLIDLGHKVIALDNFYTGRKENIEQLLSHPSFKFIHHDIIDPIDIPVDYIFNLACPASPCHYQKDPIFTTKTCVLGSLNLLELARKYSAPILQASTSEIYGDPEVTPQVETYRGIVNPIGIRSCYDEGKRCAESIFFDYHRKYNVSIKVVRIFNTYGPNMDPLDGRVVSNFIMQALKNEPITIYGDGNQTRSFCYVDDMIEGMIKMMFNTGQSVTGPINLGNPGEFTMLELAHIIIKLTGSSSQLVFMPLPCDDPQQRKPDISKANNLLSWHPLVKINDGLNKTISYFRKVL